MPAGILTPLSVHVAEDRTGAERFDEWDPIIQAEQEHEIDDYIVRVSEVLQHGPLPPPGALLRLTSSYASAVWLKMAGKGQVVRSHDLHERACCVGGL